MASKVLLVHEPTFGGRGQPDGGHVHPDDLRTAFAMAMSQMYKNEVPLYGDLIRIVQAVNREVYVNIPNSDSLDRLTLERHGAIRLGTPLELRIVRRVFAVLGMQPIGYYDLSAAGLPMHATCFRPTTSKSLARNPFRVFTTLLRPELIQSEEARQLALRMLARRTIFSTELMEMLSISEQQQGLHSEQAEIFIREALKTFRWAPVAAATNEEYHLLKAQHPILADISCFETAHINHLTPRTLNIALAQEEMNKNGMDVKDRIEGPPARQCPVLLRQTSFLALEEPIEFMSARDGNPTVVEGSHKARFGEIEERGAAVTSKGRNLYDKLLAKAMAESAGTSPAETDKIMERVFQAFPDDWNELRRQGLVYFEYSCGGKNVPIAISEEQLNDPCIIGKLVDEGILSAAPITYEDFLPFSAAGIFQSNLSGKSKNADLPIIRSSPNQDGLESALGKPIIDSDSLYAKAQEASLSACLAKLRVEY